jgi:hypothetical protein
MSNANDRHERITQPLTPVGDEATVREAQASDSGGADSELPTLNVEAPSQQEVVTPTPMPIPQMSVGQSPEPSGVSPTLWALVAISLAISLASLALNGILIYRLLIVRTQAVSGLDAAIASLDSLSESGFRYEYRLSQTIPFAGEIPFRQDVLFPFEGDIPINTTVEVPINTGFGPPLTVRVPINTSVYINTLVPIQVDETIAVETELPIDITIPLEIGPEDRILQELLSPIREWLVMLKASL